MAAPSVRVWLVLAAAVLACALLSGPANADADSDDESPGSRARRLRVQPAQGQDVQAGDPKAPENQEEEGGFGARFPGLPLPGLGPKIDRDGDGDTDEDDELPSFDTHMTILGH